jgi:hypothetical protein
MGAPKLLWVAVDLRLALANDPRDFRAAGVFVSFRGAFPPVDILAVCSVRAMHRGINPSVVNFELDPGGKELQNQWLLL